MVHLKNQTVLIFGDDDVEWGEGGPINFLSGRIDFVLTLGWGAIKNPTSYGRYSLAMYQTREGIGDKEPFQAVILPNRH